MDAIGIKAEDVEDKSIIEIWPENWIPFLIFDKMRTQWSVGMSGYTGLKYEVMLSPRGLFDMFDVPSKKRGETLAAIQIMEIEALNVMSPSS